VITPGENGFLVSPRDARALADALESLTQSPSLRRRMGQAARRFVLRKFTQQRVNAATIAVYEHLLPGLRSQDWKS